MRLRGYEPIAFGDQNPHPCKLRKSAAPAISRYREVLFPAIAELAPLLCLTSALKTRVPHVADLTWGFAATIDPVDE